MFGELDQCGYGVVLGDGLGVTAKQGAGVGVEELLHDSAVGHGVHATLKPGHAYVAVTMSP